MRCFGSLRTTTSSRSARCPSSSASRVSSSSASGKASWSVSSLSWDGSNLVRRSPSSLRRWLTLGRRSLSDGAALARNPRCAFLLRQGLPFADRYADTLICLEMPLFAFLHLWVCVLSFVGLANFLARSYAFSCPSLAPVVLVRSLKIPSQTPTTLTRTTSTRVDCPSSTLCEMHSGPHPLPSLRPPLELTPFVGTKTSSPTRSRPSKAPASPYALPLLLLPLTPLTVPHLRTGLRQRARRPKP